MGPLLWQNSYDRKAGLSLATIDNRDFVSALCDFENHDNAIYVLADETPRLGPEGTTALETKSFQTFLVPDRVLVFRKR